MSNTAKVILGLVLLIGVGTFAQHYNRATHLELAKKYCGGKSNIKHVDSKGFSCKATLRKQNTE